MFYWEKVKFWAVSNIVRVAVANLACFCSIIEQILLILISNLAVLLKRKRT